MVQRIELEVQKVPEPFLYYFILLHKRNKIIIKMLCKLNLCVFRTTALVKMSASRYKLTSV